ncbi:hypothetical protein A2U01_0012428, partial [Trifolium medium]|nr:hypothetical protein [Trifolium medium]
FVARQNMLDATASSGYTELCNLISGPVFDINFRAATNRIWQSAVPSKIKFIAR